ncbi:MAG: hypothetical protein CMP21_00635 [Rickettsiales bacterium]|nr:hypothetical protein [Rickettsiales bacterium]|tara:strand:- start:7862 stop:9091 length:1230 start_codon:yes stop_codon:yes gene_type:complete
MITISFYVIIDKNRNTMDTFIMQFIGVPVSGNMLGAIFAFFVVIFGVVVAHVITYMLVHAVRLIYTRNQLDFSLLQSSEELPQLRSPVQFVILIWSLSASLTFFELSEPVLNFCLKTAKVLTYIGFVWLGLRLTSYFQVFFVEKSKKTALKFDDLLAPLLGKVIKVLLIIVGLISVAEILNLPLASLLAGLGIGGIAIAMAAKDTIANIFGSLTVVADRPFSIGDWVKIKDVEGTVEHLGFRSTRVRTFYNSLVSVPNSILLTASVDNMGERRYRRFNTMLSITYDTPVEKIEAFCAGIRELIDLHTDTRKDYYLVHLNEFSASSLDILLYVFFQTPTWEAELAARECLMLDCIRLAQKLSIEFAFPTQTLHLNQETVSNSKMASFDSVQKQIANGQKLASNIVKSYRS